MIRKICGKCKTPVEVHPEALREVGIDPDSVKGKTFYHGAGCLDCNNTGYRGRTGIYEVMPVTQKIREMILDASNTYEIERAAIKEGMFNLNMSAVEKFKRGITTIEEVLRVTGDA